jgi:hypothetical protein
MADRTKAALVLGKSLPELDNTKASIGTLVPAEIRTCWASRRCSRPKTPTDTSLC